MRVPWNTTILKLERAVAGKTTKYGQYKYEPVASNFRARIDRTTGMFTTSDGDQISINALLTVPMEIGIQPGDLVSVTEQEQYTVYNVPDNLDPLGRKTLPICRLVRQRLT
jgi:hypothetical protein